MRICKIYLFIFIIIIFCRIDNPTIDAIMQTDAMVRRIKNT